MPGIFGITAVGSSLQLLHPTPYGEDLDGGSRLEMVPSAYEDRLHSERDEKNMLSLWVAKGAPAIGVAGRKCHNQTLGA